MGNKLASIIIKFNADRNIDSINITTPNDITGVYDDNGIITWTIGTNYGSFDKLKFVLNQVPASMGGNIFYKLIRTIPSERKVQTAFIDQYGIVIRYKNLGPYASSYKNGSVVNYEAEGNMTITTVESTLVPMSIDPFRYIVPSVRSYSSANTTVDTSGNYLYDGQLTLNPELTQVQLVSLTDLNNSNHQYMLDIDLINESGNISLKYNSTQCPNVTSVVYEMDDISISLNTDSPEVNMTYTTRESSLGISVTPDLYITRVNARLFRLSVRNSSIAKLMSNGTRLYLSLLLLPLN